MTTELNLRVYDDRYCVDVPERLEIAVECYHHSPIFNRAVKDSIERYTEHELSTYTVRGFLSIHSGSPLFIKKEDFE